jgi:hypothetical protein
METLAAIFVANLRPLTIFFSPVRLPELLGGGGVIALYFRQSSRSSSYEQFWALIGQALPEKMICVCWV